MNSLIRAENVTVRYGENIVLTDVSFDVQAGDYIGLVGANGSGKSTLMKAILGLVPIEKGKIQYSGVGRGHTGIGYLPQVAVTGNTLFPAEVREIVGIGLLGGKKFPKRITKNDELAIESILEKLGILGLKNKKIGDLSGGQQQRVLLARAMVSRPKLLILDEPTSALDPRVRSEFFALIKSINENDGTTVILVSHDLSSIKRYSKKMMVLDRELVYYGSSAAFDINFSMARGLHHHELND
ncbi:metal ABC transporter ATP-binding protein [Fusibacter tunisiensis]|uniref:Zinc transport system ATP-binding protein n=1 Tax=Fusibacter tunisiensis TaxID=1008308 RepID=A0ABS2MPF5_9FIRM|nr:ABC transporter ATP-binding protein [Fusibacter tunisiensis]MBM7561258.1 zinc transport system ATP-binding protein [Fusibacter tunisiensis]